MSKNKIANTFIANCCLFANKCQYDSDSKLVLVEGAQDYKFFTKVKHKDNVKYLDIDHFKNDYIRGYFNAEDVSSKQNILHIMGNWRIDNRLNKIVRKHNLYAIVDRDYDNEFPMGKYDRVFSSDAHDLETMLLKTDEELNRKIITLLNSSDIFDIAKFMVYQIAIIKRCLKRSNINIYYERIKASDIRMFYNDDTIDVKKYINYLVNSHERNDIRKGSLNKKAIYAAVVKSLKKDINGDGVLRVKRNEFVNKHPKDFWEIINGHDFLQVILYLSKKNTLLKELEDRSKFEYYLIDNYNSENFKNDPLYKKMEMANIV